MYTAFFDLEDEPFRMTPDPRFLYFSRRHQEAFAALVYGVYYRKGFVVLTGDIGTGKTTLCRRLMAELDGKANTALILNPTLSEGQLLSAIVEDFGVRPRGRRSKKACFDALNEFLLETAAKQMTSVLIIDEAQNLRPRTLEQIRLISNLETEREKLLQIILVGQPGLRQTLRAEALAQLRQRIAVRCRLSALDQEETAQYVVHRLQVAGGDGKDLFSLDALERIHTYTAGVPRLINALCDQALLLGYVRETRSIGAPMVEQAWQELDDEVDAV